MKSTKLDLNSILSNMERKRVYTFGNGKAEGKADMRNLLGGKGANLAEMNLMVYRFLRDSRLQQKFV